MAKKMKPESSGAEAAAAATGAEEKKPLRLDYPQTIKVGLAFAIIMLFWSMYDFVVPLLLEKTFGLSNMMRGLIMGLDNLLSLFLLPLFGKISDKSGGKLVQKFGRRTPFIIIGTVMSAVLMILVPISSYPQLKSSEQVREDYIARFNDDQFMQDTLGMFYDKASLDFTDPNYSNAYCDRAFLKMNGVDTREFFTSLRFDNNLTSSGGFLGAGEKTYKYKGVEVALDDYVVGGNVVKAADATEADKASGKTIQQIIDGNAAYSRYAQAGMNIYISEQVEAAVLSSKQGVTTLVIYMIVLLFTLIAMATYRSPAVALMPDVTPKPLRSQANAMINLMGGIGGALAFVIYTVALMFESSESYIIIFSTVAVCMVLLLVAFLSLVKEKKLVDKCRKTCEEYGITDKDEEEAEIKKMEELALVAEDVEQGAAVGGAEEYVKNKKLSLNEKIELKFNKKYAHLTPEERKVKLEKAKKVSFFLILASIFMWFMGYNAVSSNLSVYCVKALNLKASVASIISGVSMAVSAIAFIPVGILAVKIGRKRSIMLGFALATVSFVLLATPIIIMAQVELAKAALFALFYLIAGFGLIIANVNTFPMVVELAKAEDVGKYTGFYYTATMSAQAITPFIAGTIMDNYGNASLFAYSAVCVFIAIAIMFFVRYGDSMQIPTKKLTKEEKLQAMLDAADAD